MIKQQDGKEKSHTRKYLRLLSILFYVSKKTFLICVVPPYLQHMLKKIVKIFAQLQFFCWFQGTKGGFWKEKSRLLIVLFLSSFPGSLVLKFQNEQRILQEYSKHKTLLLLNTRNYFHD